VFQPSRAVFRHYRQLGVIASLIFATLVCAGLLVLRVAYAHNLNYVWLLWNLFLAWLPAASALIAYNVYKRHSRLSWFLVIACAVAWFFFLPNAPYLVTDMVHLRHQPDAPFWYDLLLLLAFAWTGLFLGLVSLLLMQEIVRKFAGTFAGWIFAVVMLGLSSFGIYLGRFLRWNSWDVLFNPFRLFVDVARPVIHPLSHPQTVVFSVLFAFFLVAMYLTLKAVMNFQPDGASPGSSDLF
jgi:uncharacterized membrane protein